MNKLINFLVFLSLFSTLLIITVPQTQAISFTTVNLHATYDGLATNSSKTDDLVSGIVSNSAKGFFEFNFSGLSLNNIIITNITFCRYVIETSGQYGAKCAHPMWWAGCSVQPSQSTGHSIFNNVSNYYVRACPNLDFDLQYNCLTDTDANDDGSGGGIGEWNPIPFLQSAIDSGQDWFAFLMVSPNGLTQNTAFNETVSYTQPLLSITYLSLSPLTDTTASAISTTSATIDGTTDYTGDEWATCGFYYSNSSDTIENDVGRASNVTCSGTYYEITEFSKSISGLNYGDYYYFRSWIKVPAGDYAGFYVSNSTGTFLTKPAFPFYQQIAEKGVTGDETNAYYNLTWSNTSLNEKTENMTTIVRYSTEGYPGTTGGTILYSGTLEWANLSTATIGQQYYFSLYHFIGASGSPYYWWFSATKSLTDIVYADTYNITFYWECNNTLINLTNTNYNTFFENSSIYGYTHDGRLVYSDTSPSSNPYTLALPNNYTLDLIVFDAEQTGMKRSIITRSGVDTYDMFICCYEPANESYHPTSYNQYNRTLYQFIYTFNMNDYTAGSVFSSSNRTQITLYRYNGTTQEIIHEDYWDAQDKISTYLHYGERYFIGCRNIEYEVAFLQYVDTLDDTEFDIIVNLIQDYEGVLKDYVSYNWSRSTASMWLNYTDNSYGTFTVNASIYSINQTDDTLSIVHQYNFSSNTSQYLFGDVNGYDNATAYYIILTVNHSTYGIVNLTYLCLPFEYNPKIDTNWINELLNEYFFDLQSVIGITFTQLLLMIMSVMCLLIVGNKNGSIGLILSGIVLIGGVTLIFNEGWAFASLAIGVGLTLILFGIIFLRGELLE